MKKSTNINLITYVLIAFIGLFMGVAELYLNNWKFWVLLILIVTYGVFNRYLGYVEAGEKNGKG